MAVTLEIGVGNLIAELFAHANVFGYALNFARAIAVFSFQAFAYSRNDFFVFVKNNFHITPLIAAAINYKNIIPKTADIISVENTGVGFLKIILTPNT